MDLLHETAGTEVRVATFQTLVLHSSSTIVPPTAHPLDAGGKALKLIFQSITKTHSISHTRTAPAVCF